MKRMFGALIMVFALAGCSVQKQAIPIGGSRSDGVVELAYEFGDMQLPQVDWAQAQMQAESRCAAWGYSGAERFGGEKRQCTAPSGYGCVAWQVTVPYQCKGGKTPT